MTESKPFRTQGLPLDEVIQECEERANHGEGLTSYDHVKASGILPYLYELAELRLQIHALRVEVAEMRETSYY